MPDSSAVMPDDGDLVILRCPSCNAGEPVKRAAISGSVEVVRCRRCGTDWKARPDSRTIAATDPRKQSIVWADAGAVEDIRKPLVGYEHDSDPWAAKRERQRRPAMLARKPSRIGRTTISLVAIAFLSAMVIGRNDIVAAAPDLAGLYAAVGLPVNLVGLEIESVSSARKITGSSVRVTVSGQLRNVSATRKDIPDIVIAMLDGSGRQLSAGRIAPPVPALEPGMEVRFVVDLKQAPKDASAIELRFDMMGDKVAKSMTGREQL